MVSTRSRWRDEGFECVLLHAALESTGIIEENHVFSWTHLKCIGCDRIYCTELHVRYYDDQEPYELAMEPDYVSDFLMQVPAAPRPITCPVAPGPCKPEPAPDNEDYHRCIRRGLFA